MNINFKESFVSAFFPHFHLVLIEYMFSYLHLYINSIHSGNGTCPQGSNFINIHLLMMLTGILTS